MLAAPVTYISDTSGITPDKDQISRLISMVSKTSI